jgi:UDP-N-acetylmuramoyl-tripeptide--D-alanyl-D-alanine ligase
MTWRVKRFFALLLFLTIFQDILCAVKESCYEPSLLLPLLATFIGSHLTEKLLFLSFKSEAKRKISNLHNLKIIAITGSYGKTSIKNFLAQVLSRKYRVYATPKSVNTLAGISKDINENLDPNTEIYIVEAGARERGDIGDIADLVGHHIGILGRVGEQHIEYFKSVEKIIETKMEISHSKNLQKLFLHYSVGKEKIDSKKVPFKVEFFGDSVGGVVSTIEGTEFNLKIGSEHHRFQTDLLGSFQGENIDVVVKVALHFGFSLDEIKEAVLDLQPVTNRLQKIRAGGKTILDDGYNGNIDGMREAFRLVEKSRGRKVIITPGLVEATDELNEQIAYEIDDIFDVVIITGSLNRELFKEKLKNPRAIKVFLEDKSKLEEILVKYTKSGDIILFANDAPNFI